MAKLSASLRVELAADAEEVWARATTLAGVNEELRPLLRMTAPEALRDASIADLEPGVPAGRSWLLLGRVLPVDYDDLTLVEIEPPRRFLERSRMLTMELWEHERVVEPLGPGRCAVTDRLVVRAAARARPVAGLGAHRSRARRPASSATATGGWSRCTAP